MKDSRLRSWARSIGVVLAALCLAWGMVVLSGCAESGELSEEELARQQDQQRAQREADSLRSVVNGLRAQLADNEQSNRSLNARVVELERKLQESAEQPKAAPVPVQQIGDPEALYKQALSKFRSHKYDEALKDFTALSESGPADMKMRASYWSGECLNGLKRYDDALQVFEKVAGVKSEKRDDAQFMLGEVYLRKKNNAKAKEEYQTLLDKYPTSEYVARAKEQIAKLK